jgi:hypothetical protein
LQNAAIKASAKAINIFTDYCREIESEVVSQFNIPDNAIANLLESLNVPLKEGEPQ